MNLGTEYKGNSPAELKAKIEELANPGKLAEFSYRDSVSGKHTYMARLANCSGSEATGRNYKGTFELSLVAP